MILVGALGATAPAAEDGVLGPGWYTSEAPPVSPAQAHQILHAAQPPDARQATATALPDEEAALTEEIRGLALALEHDPLRIFDYVHNYIAYTPSFGSMKSAEATYLAGRGNDWDQASLLIALLRAAGHQADYVVGDVTYETAVLANWIGVSNDTEIVWRALGSGGIPIDTNGTQVTLTRAWVSAEAGGTICVFDAAMKTCENVAGIDFAGITGYDAASFAAHAEAGSSFGSDWVRNMNEPAVRADMTLYSSNLLSYILTNMPSAEVTDVIGGCRIVPVQSTNAPIVLPGALAVSGATTYSNVPSIFRHTLRVQHAGIDEMFYTFQLADKRITLQFTNTTYAPILMVDGQVVAVGSATGPGEDGELTVSIDHPYPARGGTYIDQSHAFRTISDGFYTLACDFDSVSDDLISRARRQSVEARLAGATNASESVMGESLRLAGLMYFHQGNLFRRLLTRLGGTGATMHHQIGLLGQHHSYYMDMAMIIESSYAAGPTAVGRSTAQRIEGLMMSALEHGTLEQLQGGARVAASTVKLVAVNNANGDKTFLVNSDDPRQEQILYQELTNYPSHFRGDIGVTLEENIGNGVVAVCPHNGQIAVGDWHGAGVIMYDGRRHGFAALIDGDYHGGYAGHSGAFDSAAVDAAIEDALQFPDEQGWLTTPHDGDPVDMTTGAFHYELTDLALPRRGPRRMLFSRRYNSRESGRPGLLGYGWRHNLAGGLTFSSDGLASLGARGPSDAAALLAHTSVMLDFLGNRTNVASWVVGCLATQWAMDQMTENAVVVDTGNGLFTYIRQPDGRFTAPPGVRRALLHSGSTYFLQGPSDNRSCETFDAAGNLTGWADANGNTVGCLRDGQGRFLSTSNNLGQSLTFSYTNGLISQVADHAGRRVVYEYAQSNLASSTGPEGDVTRYAWDGKHRLLSVTQPRGNVTVSNAYDAAGRVVRQRDASGNLSRYAWGGSESLVERADGTRNAFYLDARGRLSGLRDGAGNTARLSWLPGRQLGGVTDRMGDATDITYHEPSAEIATYRDAEGNLYSNTYTAVDQVITNPVSGAACAYTFYNLTRRDYPDGSYETFVYDGRGNLLSRRDRRGEEWTYTYNSRGQVLTATNPEGGVSTYTYETDGTLATRTDSDTGRTTYTYDGYGRLVGIERPDGTTVRMGYDLNDCLTAYTNASGEVTVYDYDANGNPVTITDPLAHARGYMYDEMDRVTNMADSVGPVVAYGYDALGRVESVTDADGQVTEQDYDPRGWVTNVTRDGESWATGYDAEGVPSSGTTPTGRETTYQTDKLGMTTGVVDALDQTHALERDALGRVVRSQDPLGRATTYRYDAAGNVVAVTAPLVGTATAVRNGLGLTVARTNFNGETWTYGYTPMGRLAAVTNPLGHATEYSYDTMGRLGRTDYADGTHTEVTYDEVGRAQTRQDRGGHVSSYGYDALDRMTGITNPAGGAVDYAYNPDGTRATRTDTDVGVYSNRYDTLRRLEQVTAPDGATMRFEYDAFNRVTNVVDPLAHARGYEYDADGRLVRQTDPLAHARGYAYDALGRLTNMTDRLGNAVRYEYDAVGNLVRRTDAEGVVVEYTYDAANRRTAMTLGGQTARYAYDDENRLTSSTTPMGRATTVTRDAMGSLKTVADSMGHTTTFTRDELQRPAAVVDRLGRTTAFCYEPRGLLASVSNAVSEASYTYDELGKLRALTDPNGEDWTFGYTRMGRLETAVDPLSRTNVYTYSLRGRSANVTFPDGHSVAIGRDLVGNVTNRTYTDGTTVIYEYDPLNRLVGTKGTTLEIAFAYDAEGRLTATDNPGMVFGASYDKAGRLKTAAYSNGAFSVTYTYDASGLLTQVEDSLTRTVLTLSYDADRRLTRIMRPNGVNTIYTWNDAGRIVRIRDGSVLDLRYELDAEGQLTAARIKAPLTAASLLASGTQTHTFDAAAQLSTAGHAYDARGRQTANPDATLTWNDAGHLTEVSHTSYTSHMSYNGPGDLVTRSEGAATTHFYYNYAIAMKPIVAERDDAGGQFLRYYVWMPDGRLLYMIDVPAGNKVYHYHYDRVGSTLALTDAAGAVTDAYVYTPYGGLLQHNGPSAQPFTFVGRWGVRQENDAVYHMRARCYDAQTGTFLSRDPVWPILKDLRSLNPYQYAKQSPLGYIDPGGKMIAGTISWYNVGNKVIVEKFLKLAGGGQKAEPDWVPPIGPMGPPSGEDIYGLAKDWVRLVDPMGPPSGEAIYGLVKEAEHWEKKATDMQARADSMVPGAWGIVGYLTGLQESSRQKAHNLRVAARSARLQAQFLRDSIRAQVAELRSMALLAAGDSPRKLFAMSYLLPAFNRYREDKAADATPTYFGKKCRAARALYNQIEQFKAQGYYWDPKWLPDDIRDDLKRTLIASVSRGGWANRDWYSSSVLGLDSDAEWALTRDADEEFTRRAEAEQKAEADRIQRMLEPDPEWLASPEGRVFSKAVDGINAVLRERAQREFDEEMDQEGDRGDIVKGVKGDGGDILTSDIWVGRTLGR